MESLNYGFVVKALIAGLILGPLLGALGTLVVVKRLAFFSEAVGHAALTGISLGILAGEPYTAPYGGLLAFCLIFGILLNFARLRTGLASDTLIGVFLALALALGASMLLVLAARINIHILENVLFGSILTVDNRDLIVLGVVAVLTVGAMIPTFRGMILASIDPMLARVRGVAVKPLEYLFIVMVTIVTIAAVKIVGAILVGALLVIPAATARILANSLKGFVAISVALASIACVAGVLLPIEFALPLPSGAAIILVAGSFFLLALTLKPLWDRMGKPA